MGQEMDLERLISHRFPLSADRKHWNWLPIRSRTQ